MKSSGARAAAIAGWQSWQAATTIHAIPTKQQVGIATAPVVEARWAGAT
jgi:hypothetical protein